MLYDIILLLSELVAEMHAHESNVFSMGKSLHLFPIDIYLLVGFNSISHFLLNATDKAPTLFGKDPIQTMS